MPISSDCVKVTENGRNLTPSPILQSAQIVFDGVIDLDPCSDEIANQFVKANNYFSFEQDGLSHLWKANTLWMNPPGTSKNKGGKTVYGIDWYRKFLHHFRAGDINHGILLIYRIGSIGSLPNELLSYPLCITTGESISPTVNKCGRISFYTVQEDNSLKAQTSPTFSSAILMVSKDSGIREKFYKVFSQYGVIKT